MTASQALTGTSIHTSSAPRRAIRSSPAASNNVTMAVFRPGFRQQRFRPQQQRCGPRQACGPGIAFGMGPMGFRGMVNGRQMTAEEMMRVRVDLCCCRPTRSTALAAFVFDVTPCCPALLSLQRSLCVSSRASYNKLGAHSVLTVSSSVIRMHRYFRAVRHCSPLALVRRQLRSVSLCDRLGASLAALTRAGAPC